MIARLITLIKDYQAAVREALDLFKKHKGITPGAYWQEMGLPQLGSIDDEGRIEYFFHGIGCAVTLPSGSVDWNWGYEDRIDGFDAWRLWHFAKARPIKYPEFLEEETEEQVFREAVAQGLIRQNYKDKHDPLFYFTD